MRLVLKVLYLALYLGLIVAAMSDNLAQQYPHWLTGLDLAVRSSAAICILLYIFRHRPEALRFLWKLLPGILVVFEIFSWYYDFFVTVDPDVTALGLGLAVIVGVVVISPSWYISFRFGYLEDIGKTSGRTQTG